MRPLQNEPLPGSCGSLKAHNLFCNVFWPSQIGPNYSLSFVIIRLLATFFSFLLSFLLSFSFLLLLFFFFFLFLKGLRFFGETACVGFWELLHDEVLSINPKHYREIYLLLPVPPPSSTSLLPNTFFFYPQQRRAACSFSPRVIQQNSLREELKSSMSPLTGARAFFSLTLALLTFDTKYPPPCSSAPNKTFLRMVHRWQRALGAYQFSRLFCFYRRRKLPC